MAASITDNNNTARIKCHQTAIIDTELRIRHGVSLTLRNLGWHLTEQAMGEPLLGSPLLTSARYELHATFWPPRQQNTQDLWMLQV